MCWIGKARRASTDAVAAGHFFIGLTMGWDCPPLVFVERFWTPQTEFEFKLRCFMKNRAFPAIVCGLIFLALLMMAVQVGAGNKKDKKTFCSIPHPEQLCSAKNTCGSGETPCILEVKRTGGGDDASVTPNIPDFPKDTAICINTGTNVTWQGAGKNTGVMVDFGATSPFDPPGTIMGGSDRPVTVVAKRTGCFRYALGACTPGSIYGMCGNSDLELIVTSGK
jgi:hypothetical protein